MRTQWTGPPASRPRGLRGFGSHGHYSGLPDTSRDRDIPVMEIYMRGGGFVGFGAVQKSDQVGMGAWRHVGGRNYVSRSRFFGYAPAPGGAPDGPPTGTRLKVSSTIQLNAAGTAFSSSETADVVNLAGNVLARICGHREVTRLQ